MNDRDIFKFNFWPGFADLMLSLVLVVLIILFSVSSLIAGGTIDLEKVEKNQDKIVGQIKESVSGHYNISENRDEKADIYVLKELDRQIITFSDKVLFDSDEYLLKDDGKIILSVVSNAIKGNLDYIQEIQIQGHADTDGGSRYGSNLKLASLRAISVHEFLQSDGIDPVNSLMSITSFGEYKPIQRRNGEKYIMDTLKQANSSSELKAKNRRIEILLFYKNEMGHNS